MILKQNSPFIFRGRLHGYNRFGQKVERLVKIGKFLLRNRRKAGCR